MLENVFGMETSLAVRFIIAFIVVFALIGAVAWLIRRFGSGQLGNQTARGRAPRLAVIEASIVDNRRRLVLIRRDNAEHLLMIGGPTDIVVEQNIVRGQSATRGNMAEALTQTAEDENGWPAAQSQPAPVETLRPAARASRQMSNQIPGQVPVQTPIQAPSQIPAQAPAFDEAPAWPTPAEPKVSFAPLAARRPRAADLRAENRGVDTLNGLAAELAGRATPQTEPASEAETRFEPKLDIRAAQPAPVAPRASEPNPAEAAQQLEAALRRAAPQAAIPPVPEKPVAAQPQQPATSPGDMFNSLEEEMANLLGRPQGKT